MGLAKKVMGKDMPSMPPKGKYKGVVNSYDNRRPKKQAMTRTIK
jgi:hypothetical protein